MINMMNDAYDICYVYDKYDDYDMYVEERKWF